MTLNTKSVVKRLEILKLSDSDNIVGVVESTVHCAQYFELFELFYISLFEGFIVNTPIPGVVDCQKINLIHF